MTDYGKGNIKIAGLFAKNKNKNGCLWVRPKATP